MRTGPSLNKPYQIIVTCEHGGNRIPPEYTHLFRGKARLLESHKSFDYGAAELAEMLAGASGAWCRTSDISRLLIDLNRSPKHQRLFSRITGGIPPRDKLRILDRYYYPYRTSIEQHIARTLRQEKTPLHIAVHTFTPVFEGEKRRADIGLLYDPARTPEKEFCLRWQKAFGSVNPLLVVRRNYPYLGKTDGLVTYCRKKFPPGRYVGIELEVNQKCPRQGGVRWEKLKRDIISSLLSCLQHGE